VITAEPVADLQPGDVVEMRRISWPEGQKVVGPVSRDGNALLVAEQVVHWLDGAELDSDKVVTVISRAPRSLYVNHPRPEPVNGDTVADEDNGGASWTWHRIRGTWYRTDGVSFSRDEMPTRLRLLVDGETGQVVP
jgi:hypothetical protein